MARAIRILRRHLLRMSRKAVGMIRTIPAAAEEMVPMATAVRGTRAAAPAAGKARTAEVRAAARRTEAIVRVEAEPAEAEPAEAEVQAKADPKEAAVRAEADLKEATLPAGMEVRTAAAVWKAIPPERRKTVRAAVLVERTAEKQRKQACKGRTAHGLLCRKDRMMRQYMV